MRVAGPAREADPVRDTGPVREDGPVREAVLLFGGKQNMPHFHHPTRLILPSNLLV